MKNTWSTKSSLTNKELECINNISQLFNQEKSKTTQLPSKEKNEAQEKVVVEKVEKDDKENDELNELIKDAQKVLDDLELRGKSNIELVGQIEMHKGQVLANTKDFQQSCISILNREKMLSKVAREIERYLQHYKNYDECYFILNHQEVTEDPKELLQILNKIQQGVTFFKKNNDFQKAEIFQRRFEKLKEHALEKINIKVLKILRDINAEINLRIVTSEVFDKAAQISDLNVSQIFYPRPKPEKLFEVVKLFIATIEERYRGMGEYFEFLSRIYDEYFDNRTYLLDQYITAFMRIIDQQHLALDDFLIEFLRNYGNLIQQEEEYFEVQFGGVNKFKMFKRDYEFEVITKYIKPKIRECQDFQLLCTTIDRAKEDEMARTVNEETCQKLFGELEDKLQIVFYNQALEIFNHTNLLNQGVESIEKIEFPLEFISKLKELLDELKLRVTIDIYIGLMLEVSQKMLAEHLQPFMDNNGENVEGLIVVLSNLMFMQQNILIKESAKKKTKGIETASLYQEEEEEKTKGDNISKDPNELESEMVFDENFQQPSFIESIWHYVTETTYQYTSIFNFIEESIPKLKKIQMEDMNQIFEHRVQQCKKRLFKNFVRESLRDLKNFQQNLKVEFRNMSQSEKESLFISSAQQIQLKDDLQQFTLQSIKQIYEKALINLSQKYIEFNQKTQNIQDKLGVEGVVILAQMKDELRIKCLNYFQKFQQFLSQYYDKQQYEDIGIKSGREILRDAPIPLSDNQIYGWAWPTLNCPCPSRQCQSLGEDAESFEEKALASFKEAESQGLRRTYWQQRSKVGILTTNKDFILGSLLELGKDVDHTQQSRRDVENHMRERIKQNLSQYQVEGLSQDQIDSYINDAAQVICPLRQTYEKQIRKFLRQMEKDYIEKMVQSHQKLKLGQGKPIQNVLSDLLSPQNISQEEIKKEDYNSQTQSFKYFNKSSDKENIDHKLYNDDQQIPQKGPSSYQRDKPPKAPPSCSLRGSSDIESKQRNSRNERLYSVTNTKDYTVPTFMPVDGPIEEIKQRTCNSSERRKSENLMKLNSIPPPGFNQSSDVVYDSGGIKQSVGSLEPYPPPPPPQRMDSTKDKILKIMNRGSSYADSNCGSGVMKDSSSRDVVPAKRMTDQTSELDSERVKFQVNCPVQMFSAKNANQMVSSNRDSDQFIIQESDSVREGNSPPPQKSLAGLSQFRSVHVQNNLPKVIQNKQVKVIQKQSTMEAHEAEERVKLVMSNIKKQNERMKSQQGPNKNKAVHSYHTFQEPLIKEITDLRQSQGQAPFMSFDKPLTLLAAEQEEERKSQMEQQQQMINHQSEGTFKMSNYSSTPQMEIDLSAIVIKKNKEQTTQTQSFHCNCCRIHGTTTAYQSNNTGSQNQERYQGSVPESVVVLTPLSPLSSVSGGGNEQRMVNNHLQNNLQQKHQLQIKGIQQRNFSGQQSQQISAKSTSENNRYQTFDFQGMKIQEAPYQRGTGQLTHNASSNNQTKAQSTEKALSWVDYSISPTNEKEVINVQLLNQKFQQSPTHTMSPSSNNQQQTTNLNEEEEIVEQVSAKLAGLTEHTKILKWLNPRQQRELFTIEEEFKKMQKMTSSPNYKIRRNYILKNYADPFVDSPPTGSQGGHAQYYPHMESSSYQTTNKKGGRGGQINDLSSGGSSFIKFSELTPFIQSKINKKDNSELRSRANNSANRNKSPLKILSPSSGYENSFNINNESRGSQSVCGKFKVKNIKRK